MYFAFALALASRFFGSGRWNSRQAGLTGTQRSSTSRFSNEKGATYETACTTKEDAPRFSAAKVFSGVTGNANAAGRQRLGRLRFSDQCAADYGRQKRQQCRYYGGRQRRSDADEHQLQDQWAKFAIGPDEFPEQQRQF